MIVEQSSLWRIVQQTIVEGVFKHAASLGRKSKSEQLTTTRSPTQKTTWRLGTGKDAVCRVEPIASRTSESSVRSKRVMNCSIKQAEQQRAATEYQHEVEKQIQAYMAGEDEL